MKAEVEQLTLENLSLKAMHQHCDHSVISGLELNGGSVVLSNDEDFHVDKTDNAVLSSFPHSVPNYLTTPSIKSDVDSPARINCSEKSISIKSPLTKEFQELQDNVLKKFEAKLNECVSNFQTDSNL